MSGNRNYDSTQRTKIVSSRTVFANRINTEQLIQNGVPVGNMLRTNPTNSDSSYVIDLGLGATNTTGEELRLYIGEQRQPTQTASPPGAPTDLVATPGDESLTIDFTPGDNGGSPITNYEYWILDASGGDFTPFDPPVGNVSSVIVTGLINGTTHSIQLRAVNSAGVSPASETVTGTPATVPDAPVITSITAGNGQVSIAYTLGSNGGSAITNLQYSINSGTNFTNVATANPIIVTGLTNGTSYPFAITAVNAVGISDPSNIVSATPGIIPNPPSGLSGVGGDGRAYILFTPGANGGVAISNYYYSIDGGSTFTEFSPAQTQSPVDIPGLTNGTPYTIQLKAFNGSLSIASASVTVTPQVNTLRGTNLLINLDAGNSSSYPGSGTTWTNLASAGAYSATLTAGTAYSAADGGKLIFDGVSQVAQIADNTAIRATTTQFITAQVWCRVLSTGLENGDGIISKGWGAGASRDYDGYSVRINTATNSLILLMNGASRNQEGYALNNTFTADTWALYSAVICFGGSSGTPSRVFQNAIQTITLNSTETGLNFPAAPLQFPRGIQEVGFTFAPAEIGAIYYYNTNLSQADVIRNFDATRARYSV